MERLKKHRKLLIILGIAAVVVIVLLVRLHSAASRRMSPDAIASAMDTAYVEKRSLVESISATGSLTSLDSKDVTANVSGVEVLEVPIKVGDTVSVGDVLCLLDSSDLEQDLKDAQNSLNATEGKTEIDVSAAERSLAEAEATRNIEVERANQDAADAWNDYLEALTDLEEAENEYIEAQATTAEKNGEYEYYTDLMEEAKENLENASTGDNASSVYEVQFENTKSGLSAIVSGFSNYIAGSLNKIYLLSTDLPNMTATDIVDTSVGNSGNENTTGDDTSSDTASYATEEDINHINEYLNTLKSLQSKYNEARDSETDASEAYSELQEDYQELQSEVSSWQSKYNTAKSEESSKKSAYENAITTADSKLDVYNTKVRSYEDSVRNNDSAVNTKTDSLKTSQLNASISGASDRQQISSYQKQIDACTVTAPISGIITAVNVEAGDNYTGMAVATIENNVGYEVSTEIDEYDIGKVQVGQTVIIKTNGTDDEEFRGTVREIAPRATTGSSNVTYTVKISVEDSSDAFKMDMTAKCSIVIDSKENVLTVPYTAVQTADDGSFYIEVLSGEDKAGSGFAADGTDENSSAPETEDSSAAPETGKAGNVGKGKASGAAQTPSTRRITVEKGIESDYYVEISGDGVEEGMEVVLPASKEQLGSTMNFMGDMGPMGGF